MSKLCLFVNRESVLQTPFKPRPKPNGAGAAAIGGDLFLGILGNIMNQDNVNNTNRMNYMIAQENRKAQIAENEKSRQFSEKMWNLQNEYNSPLNQRRLNEEAGYNPYLLGDGQAGQGAGIPINPATSPLPTTPAMVAPKWESFGSVFSRLVQLSQNQEQISSNVNTQRAQAISMINDTLLKTLKDAGPEAVDRLAKSLSPILDGLDWKNTPSYQLFMQEFTKYQRENEWQKLQNQVFSIYGKDTAEATLNNLRKTKDVMDSQIKSLDSQSNLNEAYAERTASEIARNFAEAFNAKKEGEYYYVSAEQLGIINRMLDMQEQEMQADFSYNTGVRKYKKDIANRSDRLGLLIGSLGVQNTQNQIKGNKYLQFGKEVLEGVGNLFKVNFGMSTNRTNFNNLNPQNQGKMFYSGDGYYMNDGVLLKGSW